MSTQDIVKRFGVPAANVRRQYRENAKQLEAMATRAGAGIYNGKPASYWSAKAREFKRKGNECES